MDRLASARVLTEGVSQIQKAVGVASGSASLLVRQRSGLQPLLEENITTSETVSCRVGQVHAGLQDQKLLITEVRTAVSYTQQCSESALGICTRILGAAISGLMTLWSISARLQKLFDLCKAFTEDMRLAMSEILNLFRTLHTTLTRLESAIPHRINLPIVKFADAFCETMALPFQLCESPEIFHRVLGVLFSDTEDLVTHSFYSIRNAQGNRLILFSSWSDVVRQNDHLSMLIAPVGFSVREGYCPYSACSERLRSVASRNGAQECLKRGRWSIISPSIGDLLFPDPNPLHEYIICRFEQQAGERWFKAIFSKHIDTKVKHCFTSRSETLRMNQTIDLSTRAQR